MGSVTSDTTEVGAPQEVINKFWEDLITKRPAKVTKIFPPSLYAHLLPPQRKAGIVKGKNAAESYQAAADECRARVKRIVRECQRTNEKFTDPDFDIEDPSDKNCLEGLKFWYNDQPAVATSAIDPSSLGYALSTLVSSDVLMTNSLPIDLAATSRVLNGTFSGGGGGPGSVHRVDWIFENPQFEVDGFSSSDLCQGSNGDCWFIAAVATICSNPDLMKKVCVERDEECGVYGFVFYRDGEWIWTVVDDNLYLSYKDFDSLGDRYDPTGKQESRWKKNNQTGSEALYFASCADENETWLPLLEKAYAKVHGDFDAIAGGWSGEAVEDLTGGVTSKILTDRVLSKQRLWEELLQANKTFLFSASSPGSYGDDSDARRGLALSHAYSVIKAVDEEDESGKKHKLVLIRNPWGRRANAAMGEWTGPWSDGSSEWTPYWMKKLGHTFGDDGLFWMSYEDLLKRFDLLDRTRLFDEKWTVVQHWTSVSVAWVTGYLNTKFVVEIKKAGPAVFVLSQLDDRYFRGLEGKYNFDLHFILQEKGAETGEHLIRARGPWFGNRSISAEIDLPAGVYEIVPKIEASRNAGAPDVHEVVTVVAERNPQKLRQIGLNYDIANARGIVELTEEEQKKKDQKKKEAAEKKKKEKEEEEKEKVAFESWKKDEKADYEAWKKEKKDRTEKEKPKEETAKEESKTDEAKKDVTEALAAATITDSSKAKASEPESPTTAKEPEVVIDLTIRPTKPSEPQAEPVTSPSSSNKAPEPKIEIDSASESDDKAADTPSDDDAPAALGRVPKPPASVASGVSASRRDGVEKVQGSVYGDAIAADVAKEAVAAADNKQNPWNAVCVLGLRVYSQDAEVSIKLVKPKDVEEGAILDVDGATAAGATM